MARSTTNDKELIVNETNRDTDLAISDSMYDTMIKKSDKYFDDQIDASKDWADKQTEIQNQQHNLAIQEINQQKDQAKKDYLKEQSGAYVDWQKQSDQYGANAEQMASTGLNNSGYSESSQVSMYNTYQNRVASARESFSRAVLNYDNLMAEAKIQNSAVLAEIAIEALKDQLQLSLEGFQYKNTLVLQKAAASREIKAQYHAQYMDILQQINAENALEEEKRQFNALHGGASIGSSSISKTSRKSAANVSGGKVEADKAKAAMAKIQGDITTYADAKAFMTALGISDKGQPLLDSLTWTKAKRDGQLGSEFEYYNSYAEYVQGYLAWVTS